MRRFISVLLLGGALFAPVTSFGQEAAGRVLAVAGTVTIERGAQRIAAQPGTEVRAGDTFQLGPQSNAQVRFTDDSVVALGSDTSFRVTEYAFQGRAPEAQRTFFDLIKGGMRTVTGLIGRSGRDNYGLRTSTATIGIRGTAYAACHDCISVRGEALPGTVVGFTEGSGSIRTQGGELQLSAGESAQATSANVNPVRTMSFPRTQQEARARPSASQQTQAAQTGGGAATASSTTTTSAPSADSTGTPAGTIASSVSMASTAPPAFQVTSTPAPATILETSFTGTSYYRLAGSSLGIPVVDCGSPPCGSITSGEITLGVNFALGRATIGAGLSTEDNGSPGSVLFAVPSASIGVPITVSGGQVTFSGTFNRADFPQNQGAFRCSDCSPTDGPGFVDQLVFSGTISGSTATVTLTAVGPGTDGGTLRNVVLTQATPPNDAVAAMAIQVFNGGTDTRSAGFWDVQLDASRRLLQFGPNDGVTGFGNRTAGPSASVGTATNAIVGTAPAAGNLVWGTWTGPGAQLTDSTFASYTSTAGGRLSVQPWITGEAPNTLPPSLGTLTFVPAGSVFTSATQTLNSASLIADFVNRSLTISLNATNTSGGNAYQMNSTTGFNPANSRFSAGFQTVTCTGPCNSGTGSVGGAFGGFFAGQQAQGAGVAFTAGYGAAAVAGTAGNGVTGVVAFKR